MTTPLEDPWALVTGETLAEVLPLEARPINAASPLIGCTLHGRFWWQRDCPGCPDVTTYAHLYERLDWWRDAYAAREQECFDAMQEGLL